ncbi:hypothetical protein FOXG_01557 [Fusarium oxysporum f. sp. lycopersici 4287]|uniref:Chromo domain-containing protein n=1 Tax=Fusarium oxysporum f. sp. lycopersici (strain 4287 / CBS 123668 / FGSC 9935 / NRRL 34936) TaxID=426428 RepID=A0A0J9UBB5_FUSO4|nr:hypothetical protein FOXG_01557 [Fusarium oxysporum f. sp. lycopersici 4287]KAJ9424848.1 hypothetical protein QL093DRAFT_2223995 [Fusarium oxysporum]KNA96299.1 hypothetical protein FOXG_01557 [Fusarium oxysporum f. sp. lycopersici 4287]
MVRTRKEEKQSTTNTPRTSLERKSKRKRKGQAQDTEPELVQQSPARKRRKLGKKKEWWNIRRVINEEYLANPNSGEINHRCLVEWETDSDGETYENEWIPYKDLNAEALEDWEKEKDKRERERTEREAQRRETRNRRGLRDLTPRRGKSETPVVCNKQKQTKLDASTHDISRFDSHEQVVQPNRSSRIKSEEPVPSFISASSVDAESVSSYEFSRAPTQGVAVVLSKPDNFDPSEYQSVTTQNSSQRITELEDGDQRVTFASQLSQDTIPDSQDLSGNWDYQDCESQPAARPDCVPRSPEIPEDPSSLAEDNPGSNRQVRKVVCQKEVHNRESIARSPEREAFQSANAPVDLKTEYPDPENPEDNLPPTDFGEFTGAAHHLDDQTEDIQSLKETHDLEGDNTENRTTTNNQILDGDNLGSTGGIRDILSPENESFETANSQASHSSNSRDLPVNQDPYGQDSVSVNQGSGDGQRVVQDHVFDSSSRLPFEEETLGSQQPGVKRSAPSHHQSPRDRDERPGLEFEKGDVNPQRPDKPTSVSGVEDLSQAQVLSSSSKEIDIIVPDSQGDSSLSTDLNIITARTSTLVSKTQVTSLASQAEVVSDSAATGSDIIPSRQPGHSHPATSERGILLDSSLPSDQSIRHVVGEAAASLRSSPDSHRTQKPQIYYSQPQRLYGSLDISSSLSSAAGTLNKTARPRATIETQASQEETFKASQLSKSQPEKNSVSGQRIGSSQRSPSPTTIAKTDSVLSKSKTGSDSKGLEKPRLTSKQKMERPGSQTRDSAVDELKSYIDFGRDSALTHVGDSLEENPGGTPYEAITNEEPVPGASASSHAAVLQSQPVYSMDPWKPQALGTNSDTPVSSIAPAAIMADPSTTAVARMREELSRRFAESDVSLTRSIISQDEEDSLLPATISPTVISIVNEPVASTHTLNFPNQGSVPTEVESSGHSITMGQVPVEQVSDVLSESSEQNDFYVQTKVTLPMQASRRSYYGEVIEDHKDEIQAFSRCFTGETPEEPSEELIKKIDSLFYRLFEICDYPQDVIGSVLETLPSSELARYCCDANPKFSFLFELMAALDGKEKEILIVVGTKELMRLLFKLAEAAKVECSAENINQHAKFASFARISIALTSEDFDPFSFDVIIGYDFHYPSSLIARQLCDNTVRKSPLVLRLVTTYSIEHVYGPLDGATALEVKNAILASTVSASRYLEEPERGYYEPHEVAEIFANYFNGITDTLNWEPQGIPDDVLDIFENPGTQTQLPFTGDALYGNDLKRKHFNDEGDGDAKRMRTLPLRDLPTDTNNPPMPIAVRQMLESASLRSGTRDRKAMISVPLVTLETIQEQIDEYKRQTAQAGEVEVELKSYISRLDKELKDHRKTLSKIESSNRAALQDRTVAERERLRTEGVAAAAAKVAQKEKEKQQQRIDELESVIARLNQNPESAKREEALSEVKGQLQLSESRRTSALSDVDFMKSRYQDVDAQALRLANENKSLKIQNEELEQKASENLRAIHAQNVAMERQELLEQIASLQAQLQQRDAELYNANQRLASVSNGRNTRGGSMPRSPRVPSGMSPRPRAAFSASRGTSPIGPGQPFVGQQAGNGRWNHLQ